MIGFALLALGRVLGGLGADRIERSVHARVADLHLVGDSAHRVDGPVLELKRGNLLQLGDRPRQIAETDKGSRRHV